MNNKKNIEKVVFDADRDNGGKGVPVKKIIKSLKKIKNEKKLK